MLAIDPLTTPACGLLGRASRWRAWLPKLAARSAALLAVGTIPVAGALHAAPVIVAGENFDGQADGALAPPEVAIAASPNRIVQLVHGRYVLYSRTDDTGLLTLSSGDLRELAYSGGGAPISASNPQIIWDAGTERFYVLMKAVYSNGSWLFSFAWSKSAFPQGPSDFCKQFLGFAGPPSALTLGDTAEHLLFGGNLDFRSFGGRIEAVLISHRKPPPGSACTTLDQNRISFLATPGGGRVKFPTVANGVDSVKKGFAIARPQRLPSRKIWIFPVKPGPNGAEFGAGRSITLPFEYDVPPDAKQPGNHAPLLDTGNGNFTQAVLARNPARNNRLSLWTQHTVKRGKRSAIRWYEIDPVANPPVLLRTGILAEKGAFYFNSAIAPDRRVAAGGGEFGDTFVLHFTRASRQKGVPPELRMAASFKGERIAIRPLFSPGRTYRNASCSGSAAICRWNPSAAAAPDPRGGGGPAGIVWGSAAYPGELPLTAGNWQSRIFAIGNNGCGNVC